MDGVSEKGSNEGDRYLSQAGKHCEKTTYGKKPSRREWVLALLKVYTEEL